VTPSIRLRGTTHAVLGESTNRAILCVAMTYGRESDSAYLCERVGGQSENRDGDPEWSHPLAGLRRSGCEDFVDIENCSSGAGRTLQSVVAARFVSRPPASVFVVPRVSRPTARNHGITVGSTRSSWQVAETTTGTRT
jgi:hypothetical protein